MSRSPRNPKIPTIDPNDFLLRRIAEMLDEAVAQRLGSGPELSFEQRCDCRHEVTRDALWVAEERDLRTLTTDVQEVEVNGKRYRKLGQDSSGTYHGSWGPHRVEEPLYRLVGERNGPTIKPIELRAGIVEGMLPDMARIVSNLSADQTSRQLQGTLETVRMVAPSRACLEKRVKAMASAISDQVVDLEEAARTDPLAEPVVAVSCGMDRGAVRMVEPLDPETAPPRERTKPYERTPPPPCELHYRMAWNGSMTLYGPGGTPLHTFRYAADATADPKERGPAHQRRCRLGPLAVPVR